MVPGHRLGGRHRYRHMHGNRHRYGHSTGIGTGTSTYRHRHWQGKDSQVPLSILYCFLAAASVRVYENEQISLRVHDIFPLFICPLSIVH
jgi:hypothetical protein